VRFGTECVDTDIDHMNSCLKKLHGSLLIHDGPICGNRHVNSGGFDGLFDHIVRLRMNQRLAIARVTDVLCDSLTMLPHFLDHFGVENWIQIASPIVLRALELRMRTMDACEITDLCDVHQYL